MALTFEERKKFLNDVDYSHKKEAYNLNFEVRGGKSLDEVFEKMKMFQKLHIADECAGITYNGITLVAGIYNSPAEYMETYNGVRENGKEQILKNYKPENQVDALLESFAKVNQALQEFNHAPFSEEEMTEFIVQLKSMSNKRK